MESNSKMRMIKSKHKSVKMVMIPVMNVTLSAPELSVSIDLVSSAVLN